MISQKVLAGAVLGVCLLALALPAQTPQLIPLEDFFRNPKQSSFQLSPDGQYLAFMQSWENRMNIYVQKIGTDKATRITSAKERDIPGYLWANNQRIVFVQDQGGDENFKAYAVDTDGSNLKVLTPFDKVRVRLIDQLKNNDKEMLIGLNKRDKRVFDAYRINIDTGELKLVLENPGNISGWLTDHDGKLRVATTTDGVNTSILYRETEKDKFQQIVQTNFRQTLAPLFFTFDNKNLYVASNLMQDKTALYRYDIAQKKTRKIAVRPS